MPILTENSERGVGRDCSGCVLSCAAVDTNVLCLDIHDEKHVVLRHDVHAAFAGGREVSAPIFLPGNLRRRVTNSRTLQSRRCTGADAQVHRHLGESGQHWKRAEIVCIT